MNAGEHRYIISFLIQKCIKRQRRTSLFLKEGGSLYFEITAKIIDVLK